MNQKLLAAVRAAIEAAGARPPTARVQSVGGGCINAACVLGAAGARYFVKLNEAERLPMLEAEVDGLRRLAAIAALRVPRPLTCGHAAGQAFLVLEYLEFGPASPAGFRRLGEALAQCHRYLGERHGLAQDNWIGSSPQRNGPRDDWCGFFADQRLGAQLELAAANGHGGELLRRGERLRQALPALLSGHRPPPSLLHGDLWAGNVGFDRSGRPLVFDPACYYGDRETDLAMTELFGGFPPTFYEAYRAAWPLAEGYPLRRDLYQLYHVLNHLNLFGGGYLGQARRLIDRLLAQA